MKLTYEQYEEITKQFKFSVENMDDKLVRDLFVRHPYHKKDILGKNSITIEGERGTGKSMLLREVLNKSRLETERNPGELWICKYINIEHARVKELNNLLIMFKENPEINNNIVLRDSIAVEYVNYFFLTNLLERLNEFFEENSILDKISISDTYSKMIDGFHITTDISFTELYNNTFQNFNDRKVALMNRNYDPFIFEFDKSNVIDSFLTQIKRTFSVEKFDLRNLVFTFLIDEYDSLDIFSQKAFNTIIKERHQQLNFKIALRPMGIIKDTLTQNRSIEHHDIIPFNMNPYARSKVHNRAFAKFYRDIANKRLKDTGLNIDMILGESISTEKTAIVIKKKALELPTTADEDEIYSLKYINNKIQFYGFDNVRVVASGIIRFYLKLIDQIMSAAVDKQDIYSEPVLMKYQASSIHDFSQQTFRGIFDELDSEYENAIVRFIEILGKYFSERLRTNIALNAISAFRIKNRLELDSDVLKMLNIAIKHSCIQLRPFRAAKDQPKNEPVYLLNGIN